MKRARVYYEKRLVGELLAQDGIHYFSYDPDWLKEPLPLSPDGDSIMTGTHRIPAGWEPWLIKLNTRGKKEAALIELEHAYFAMAREAGLTVPETRLIQDENGLVHFAIKRFDRDAADPNRRIHIQTYAALAGINYQEPTSDYEDLLRLTKHLTRNHEDVCEQFRRMLFNVLAYNRDDHAKNFSFRMNQKGGWSLTPAYDLLYTDNNLGGNWMTIRGKRNHLKLDDFLQLAELMGIGSRQFNEMRQQMEDALRQWPSFAKASGLGPGLTKVVGTSIQSMTEALK